MPVQLASFLIPNNGNTWFLLEDTYLKGSYRVVANVAALSLIHPMSLKAGMVVYCAAEDATYRLAADLVAWTQLTYLSAIDKGVANGLASLDANGILVASQLPRVHATTFTASSQAQMLALSAIQGDICVRTDVSKTFVLTNNVPSTLASWQDLLSSSTSYVLPAASTTVLGGIKVGSNLSIDANGALNAGAPMSFSATAPLAIGTTILGSAGISPSAARSDHVHPQNVLPYDIPFYAQALANSDVIGAFVASRRISLPIGLVGSIARTTVPATASAVLTLYVDGVAKGTVTFAAAASVGVFALAANLNIAAGSVLELKNQSIADASLANVYITLVGAAEAPTAVML